MLNKLLMSALMTVSKLPGRRHLSAAAVMGLQLHILTAKYLIDLEANFATMPKKKLARLSSIPGF